MKNPYIPKRVIALRKTLIERYFSFIERKPSDSFLWHVFLLAVIISGGLLLTNLSVDNSQQIPARGGVLREGIVGSPRFVNPVLAITRADQDMTALIYSGLMKLGQDGTLKPDIAKSVTISDDALTYNVVLRDDVRFHDGEILNADDVLFTIGLIQDAQLKSPLRGNFDGVTVEKLSDFEVNFVIEEPYAPFIENLTVGILPKHEWFNLTIDQIPFSENNSKPIGSGPYEVASVDINQSGLVDGYTLVIANTYPDRPMIAAMHLTFYPNEDTLIKALMDEKIDSASGLTKDVDKVLAARPDLTMYTSSLPRTFGIFFNQNKSTAILQEEVRRALDAAINRQELISTVFTGNAEPLTGPIPSAFALPELAPASASTSNNTNSVPTSTTKTTLANSSLDHLDKAREILVAGGWEPNEEGLWVKEIDDIETVLEVDISTANLPFLAETAEYIRKQWETLGVRVSVRQYEQADLTQAVIRTRDYQALLFGTAIGRSLDFYPFWHSSQRNDPGLNVSLYANITADAALTRARTSTSTEAQNLALHEFLTELQTDDPAIFLFAPTLTTIMPKEVIMEPITKLAAPPERYANIENWHIATESVWPIFTD